MAGTIVRGTTLFICKNGDYSAKAGIPLNTVGNRIPIGSVSLGLRNIQGSKFFKVIPVKKSLEKKTNKTIFVRSSVPKKPHKRIARLIRPKEQVLGSQFGLIKLTLIEDEIQTLRGPGINLLKSKVIRKNVHEILYALPKDGRINFALKSGQMILIVFNGKRFVCTYQ